MAPVQGKEVLVKIDDGSGTLLEVEFQNDATYNSGKTQNITRSKNGSSPWQAEAGATITFSFTKQRPLTAAQNRLYALSESGAASPCEYDDSATGGHKRAGNVHVTISDEPANTEGVVEVNVTLAFAGDPTTTVNS